MSENTGIEKVIRVSGIKKSFRIFADKSQTLKERIIHKNRGKYSVHEVLKGIDLDIEKGETVALIGQNGSGKSTLLKLLTGIMYPDAGTISIQGKVSSLLELGAGFHPDFSGRENIYNNASIFGLSKKEIDQRYEKIVAFSELEEFIDTPVRTYSSGMYMRLAFSVAINVDADVLLIDEILAVGDANFQKKCMDMIRSLKNRGVTIVLVTHDMGSVERICDRAVWLVDGVIRMNGKPREVIDFYLMNMDEQAVEIAKKEKDRVKAQHEEEATESASDEEPETPAPEVSNDIMEMNESGEKVRWGNGDVRIDAVDFLDEYGRLAALFHSGKRVTIRLRYRVIGIVESLVFGIAVKNVEGDLCIATNTDIRHIPIDKPVPDERVAFGVEFTFDSLDLAGGNYSLDVAAHSLEGLPYDYQLGRHSFLISSPYSDAGVYAPPIHVKNYREK